MSLTPESGTPESGTPASDTTGDATPGESSRTLARTDIHDPVFPLTAEVLDEHDPEAAEEYAESVGVDPTPEQVGHYAEMVGDEQLAEDSGLDVPEEGPGTAPGSA